MDGEHRGEPVGYVRGGRDGWGLKVRTDVGATDQREGPIRRHLYSGRITDWTRIEILAYVKRPAAAWYLELAPGDEFTEFHHGPFLVCGPFRFVRKIAGLQDASEAWRAGKVEPADG